MSGMYSGARWTHFSSAVNVTPFGASVPARTAPSTLEMPPR